MKVKLLVPPEYSGQDVFWADKGMPDTVEVEINA